MTREIERYWDEASGWYQKSSKIEANSAHYGPYAPNENKLRLLGNVKGKNILEIGCGGGQCSIAFAKEGAECTGLDSSREQLNYAEALARKNKVSVKFIRHDIQNLKGFKPNNYDIVFSAFALQYVPDLAKCFKEASRVLKKGGLFVFSFDHPFYLSISPKTFKIERSYNKSGRIENMETWSDGSKHKFIMYTRKIGEIYGSLLKTGFYVERIIEPFNPKEKGAWKSKGWKEVYPPKLVEMVCPTIIFKARKK
jgi:ubiquinone/menaquinone biosynthesis C-methylase UbiE